MISSSLKNLLNGTRARVGDSSVPTSWFSRPEEGSRLATREPLFTETLQVGIVVRDLDAAMKTYVHDYGIGPWDVYEMNSSNVEDMEYDGKREDHGMRVALTQVGSVTWELIEPVGENNIYADFLKERGEGLHHIGVGTTDYHAALEDLRGKGHTVLQGGKFHGALFAYPSTDKDLKFITEIFDFPEGFSLTPDYTYPAAE
jgi:methylmalonyl-CoA/ethylmalonyl-CoA epimerase